MNVFLDTNVLVEYLERRRQYAAVSRILDAVEDGDFEACISTGGLYTTTYLLTNALKRQGIHRPEQTEKTREILNDITELLRIADLSAASASAAINDLRFTDLEDGYQFHCAQQHHCSVIITINTKDFPTQNVERILVLTPEQFVKRFLP